MKKFRFERPRDGIRLQGFRQACLALQPKPSFVAINNESETGDNQAAGIGIDEGWNVMKFEDWIAQTRESDCWLDWAAFHLFAEEPGHIEPQDCEDWRLWTQREYRQNKNALMEIYACDSSWIQVVLSAGVEASFPPDWRPLEAEAYTS